MADTKLGRDLPGEDPDTPLPVHPMTDFTGYGLDADDVEPGYCGVGPDEDPDTRTGPVIYSGEQKGFLYRGRFAIDR